MMLPLFRALLVYTIALIVGRHVDQEEFVAQMLCVFILAELFALRSSTNPRFPTPKETPNE